MTRTVDLVIVGANAAAIAAMLDAVRGGKRVLVVLRAGRSAAARHLRQVLRRSQGPSSLRRLTIITGAEVACVDGVNAMEAIVVRRLRTGRLIGFNATALKGNVCH